MIQLWFDSIFEIWTKFGPYGFQWYESRTYSMHIQWIHSQVVGMQIEGGEDFLQSYVLALDIVHHSVSIYSVGLLDEAQKMLLVHAGSSMDVSVDLQRKQKRGT